MFSLPEISGRLGMNGAQAFEPRILVPREGFEPPTSCLQSRCSTGLSYHRRNQTLPDLRAGSKPKSAIEFSIFVIVLADYQDNNGHQCLTSSDQSEKPLSASSFPKREANSAGDLLI
jgi:hypothetical protein